MCDCYVIVFADYGSNFVGLLFSFLIPNPKLSTTNSVEQNLGQNGAKSKLPNLVPLYLLSNIQRRHNSNIELPIVLK